ncbi:MAG: transcription elongation factor GreB [Myxococcales bacterium]|nr:transcription elongation factor GreB [Myxococcales bacterium]
MSKAFLPEDGGEDDAEEAADAVRSNVRPGSPWITRAGYVALQRELEHLWRVERPRVTHEVAVAAAQGDRSENAEYIYGKKRLREIDRRVRFLSKRLDVLEIVEPTREQAGRVFFGARVTIEDEDGAERTYRIVGTDEPDSDKRWISVESPMARALLGKAIGDVATVLRPAGPTEVTVIAIEY